MYRTRTSVRVPAGLGIGQLIGKQGSNIKHLQSRTSARMAVDTVSETVTITGEKTDVSLALALLEAQFASWRSSGESPGRKVRGGTPPRQSNDRLVSAAEGQCSRYEPVRRMTQPAHTWILRPCQLARNRRYTVNACAAHGIVICSTGQTPQLLDHD